MINLRKMLKKQKGFTLVELIVVIAILGILAAIAVPSLGGFRDSAQTTADSAHEQVIRNAAQIYMAENGIPTDNDTIGGTITNEQLDKYIDGDLTGASVTVDANGNITEVTPGTVSTGD